MRARLASRLSLHRAAIVRLGVVACVVTAGAFGLIRLNDALGLLDARADRNASLDYTARTYLSDHVLGSARVVEDARLWMPNDVTYRVVVGPNALTTDQRFAHLFLLGLMFPRRQSDSKSAPFVLCFECDKTSLGSHFDVLSDNGHGLTFGRVTP